MSGNYKFLVDQKDIVRFLTVTVGSFIQDCLINKEQRVLHKEQCAERLAAEDGSSDREGEVRYSDQAVLANLDWGIDALEEAINTSNAEAKLARLDYAEKMLQVCAMLNSTQKTAGVPNFYLSAWSHLNLAFLWKLRNDAHKSVLHILEMFVIDPFFSRIDFAPKLWKALFLPHMSSIVGWYSEARHKLVMEVIPDSADLSFTADFDQFFNESLIFTSRPDQAEKLRNLEQLYGQSLDENTRLYAKHFKGCMNSDSTATKKVIPMLPIAEPPMTPLHEVSRSIPDYVKFGPILPRSAGFSPFVDDKEHKQNGSRSDATAGNNEKQHYSANSMKKTRRSDLQLHIQDASLEGDEDVGDSYAGSEFKACTQATFNSASEDVVSTSKVQSLRKREQVDSPIKSPKSASPKILFPNPQANSKRETEPILRLLSGRLATSMSASLPESPNEYNEYSMSLSDFDGEMIELQKKYRKTSPAWSMSFENIDIQALGNSCLNESEESQSLSNVSLPSSGKLTPKTRPPKDFVCPITSQLFSDPVTLETGQTYERKAIQEWLKRGNTTCPITRQPLSSTTLPKTNYVLKRLITSWKEQYPDLAQEFSHSETPITSISSSPSKGLPFRPTVPKASILPMPEMTDHSVNKRSNRFTRAAVSRSPTSVISQAAAEAIINGLKPYTTCLCTSEDLQECEAAVLTIASIWKDSKGDTGIHSYLSKPAIINGFAEVLLASVNREALTTSIYVLSELIFADESVAEILTSVDSDFDCLAALLKNGLAEAAVLIYQLRPTHAQLCVHDLVSSLVLVLNRSEKLDNFQLSMDPKDAAIALLEQIVVGGDENSQCINALCIISANGLPSLIKCLERFEGRQSVVAILVSCIRADRSCRHLIADKAELSHVLELFHAGNDRARAISIDFLAELVRLNRQILIELISVGVEALTYTDSLLLTVSRRSLCNQILQIIKDGGAFSTMHTFLVYLQMAPIEQQPTVACLLLQLDLLVEPRKMSIYREEALEALIEALRRKDFPICQRKALDVFGSLSGRFTARGDSLTEVWLLHTAGLDQRYDSIMKADKLKVKEDEFRESMEDEDKAANAWEKRMAFVICNHENGSVFRALEECLTSNSLEMVKSCLVIATWLTHMLTYLPNTGARDTARNCLLSQFINVLQSSRNLEERVLSTLSLKSFINDQVAVSDIVTALINLPSVDAIELWSCAEAAEVDAGNNAEVLSLVHFNNRVFSSQSDGSIKLWDSGKRGLKLAQEVRDHTKAVTSLLIPNSGDKLYSGSLDKTIRVWSIKSDGIHCLQVHDVKEPVQELVACSSFACFASQGAGVKIYNWNGVPKHINFNKNVKSLAKAHDKLYCGCSGYSIQEVDLVKFTSNTFFSGTRKLLGKQNVYALTIRDDTLFAGGTSVDGIAGKVFSLSTKAVIGSLPTAFDVHCIAVSNDFVFNGTKCGIIDVYLKERFTKVASIRMNGGGNTKITSLTLDSDGEMLFAGSADGKIQGWVID
ncbi:hypothetical protein Sjap_009992 [Stephania japonica]|uniref:RING-type E3 ubiquitin transferase n=1 Tax=Stephania japonica TaxID=461633 RepID=A0AAP0P5Z5_9MAGN